MGRDSFGFIPTINNSEESTSGHSSVLESENDAKNGNSLDHYSQFSAPGEVVEKRIVSYYLEEHLVERLKRVADERKMYYSTLVNHAICLWLESRGYD